MQQTLDLWELAQQNKYQWIKTLEAA